MTKSNLSVKHMYDKSNVLDIGRGSLEACVI